MLECQNNPLIGATIAAAGVITVGLGAWLALRARAQNDDARAHCPRSPECNDPTGPALTHDATASANTATAFLIGGGVATAVGVLVYVLSPPASVAPSRESARWRLRLGGSTSGVGAALGRAW